MQTHFLFTAAASRAVLCLVPRFPRRLLLVAALGSARCRVLQTKALRGCRLQNLTLRSPTRPCCPRGARRDCRKKACPDIPEKKACCADRLISSYSGLKRRLRWKCGSCKRWGNSGTKPRARQILQACPSALRRPPPSRANPGKTLWCGLAPSIASRPGLLRQRPRFRQSRLRKKVSLATGLCLAAYGFDAQPGLCPGQGLAGRGRRSDCGQCRASKRRKPARLGRRAQRCGPAVLPLRNVADQSPRRGAHDLLLSVYDRLEALQPDADLYAARGGAGRKSRARPRGRPKLTCGGHDRDSAAGSGRGVSCVRRHARARA